LPASTDEELMVRVQQHDAAAFTALLDRHLAPLQRFLLRATGNPADADELSQETMLRVWRHAQRWQSGRVKFSTWLFRIARNLAIDSYRRARDTTATGLDEALDDSPDAVTALEDARRAQHLRQAIAALPERQRTALLLCHFDGFSNPDAAAVLQVSVEALESLLARARRSLKATMVPLLQSASSPSTSAPPSTHRPKESYPCTHNP
jgi:RNA polymerase sigma-70 factor (ECF subfamily)